MATPAARAVWRATADRLAAIALRAERVTGVAQVSLDVITDTACDLLHPDPPTLQEWRAVYRAAWRDRVLKEVEARAILSHLDPEACVLEVALSAAVNPPDHLLSDLDLAGELALEYDVDEGV